MPRRNPRRNSQSFDNTVNLETAFISVARNDEYIALCSDSESVFSSVSENGIGASGEDSVDDEDWQSTDEELYSDDLDFESIVNDDDDDDHHLEHIAASSLEPLNRKKGKRSFRGQDRNNWDGIGVLVRKDLEKAFANPVVFEHFSVAENVDSLLKKGKLDLPDQPITRYWDGTQPQVAVDRDGIPIVVYLPGLYSEADNTQVCDTMTRFHRNNESSVRPKAASTKARNQASNFKKDVEGSESAMIGVIELGVLVEQGYSDQEPRASAAQFHNTVTSVAERVALNKAYSFARHAENTVLSYIDPNWYTALASIRNGLRESDPTNQLIQGIDPSLWPAHTVTWDRHIHSHFDTKDHPRGWAALSVYGTFDIGGDLCIATLGLRIRFKPRDGVWLRGRLLKHSVKDFDGGHRFAHTSYLPFSMVSHYQHLLFKRVSRMRYANFQHIRAFLQESHRKRRKTLSGKLRCKKKGGKASVRKRRIEMELAQNEKTFTEKHRRAMKRKPNQQTLVENQRGPKRRKTTTRQRQNTALSK